MTFFPFFKQQRLLGRLQPQLSQIRRVYPSCQERVPKSTQEAMGRPIITTDAPGCRETVIEGLNGFLVPVRDVGALVRAMERFILEPDLIERMGKESRRLAEERFDVHKIKARFLQEMGL